jgi:RsiW-degrading membrane proteinase PrsW (M82 family)
VTRHPFDPVSAVLGIVTVTVGLLVVAGAGRDLGSGGPWWMAAAAALVGLVIIPWRRRRGPDVAAATVSPDDA